MVAGADEHHAHHLLALARCTDAALLNRSGPRTTWRVRHAGVPRVAKVWRDRDPDPAAVRTHREVLPVLRPALAPTGVVVPEVVAHHHDPRCGHVVVMAQVEGTDLRHRWHYDRPGLAGGAALSTHDIDRVVGVLAGLAATDAGPAVTAGLPPTPFARLARRAAQALEPGDADAAEGLATRVARAEPVARQRRVAASNGDLRFANMLALADGRTAVVDWDGARASTHEIEHCVAYLRLFLWARPDLVAHLEDRAHADLGVDPDLLLLAGLERAANQVQVCRDHPQRQARHRHQLEQLRAEARGRPGPHTVVP